MARGVLTGLVAALVAYVFVLGGTWNGAIMHTGTARLSVTVLGGTLALWWAWRTRQSAHWPRTTLDPALPAWLFAFAVSTLFNLDALPQIGVGLWFAGLYTLVWYVVQDALANRFLTPATLTDGFLIAAGVLIIGALGDWMRGVERLAAFQGNPNIVGALLVLVVPLAAGRLAAARGSRRAGWLLYLGLMLLLVWLSGSRGTWLGILAAAGTLISLRAPRTAAVVAVIAVPVALALFLLRGDTGRGDLYLHALRLFAEAPLTGHGLFTFRLLDTGGSGVIHLHAHNVFLHLAAELGVPGLVALAVTLWQVARRAVRGQIADGWPLAALVGALAHLIVDFAVISPGVALSVVLVLCIALPPAAATPDRRPAWLVVGLAVILVTAGLIAGRVPDGLI